MVDDNIPRNTPSSSGGKLTKKTIISIIIALIAIIAIIIGVVVAVKHSPQDSATTDSPLTLSTQSTPPDDSINSGPGIKKKEGNSGSWDDGTYEESAKTVYSEALKQYHYDDLGLPPDFTMSSFNGAFYPPRPKKKYRHFPQAKYMYPQDTVIDGYKNVDAENFIFDVLHKGFTIRVRNYSTPICSFMALGPNYYTPRVYSILKKECRKWADPEPVYAEMMERDVTLIPLIISTSNDGFPDPKTGKMHTRYTDTRTSAIRKVDVLVGTGKRYFDQCTVRGGLHWDVYIEVQRSSSSSPWKVSELEFTQTNSDMKDFASDYQWKLAGECRDI